MKKTTFDIPKMDCAAEEQMIRMKFDGDPEIVKLDFNLAQRRLEVYHNGEPTAVANRLSELNFGSRLVDSVLVERSDQGDLRAINAKKERKMLWAVLFINAGAFVLEMVTGLVAKSMGLVADSLDMLADAFVYSLSLYAVGKAAGSKKKIAAISGYMQLLLALVGMIEVLRRFIGQEEAPDFGFMIVISIIALAGNAVSLYLIQRANSREAHMQASYIFTSNDVIVNLGVILAGVLVYFTGSKIPDLLIGAMVFAIVARGAFRILKLAK
ncbi:cation transporter [Arcticibacter sp.]|jgi:Co/Zn/Cd efflux system component|uniref:cation transporter n=1 Tax=Arcticibacter sp. TaxID=1872630 RepID=UPI00389031BC